jgi:hypothetical protein
MAIKIIHEDDYEEFCLLIPMILVKIPVNICNVLNFELFIL